MFIDFKKDIKKHPPVEFVKVSRVTCLDLFGQMPTHEANNCSLKDEKASWMKSRSKVMLFYQRAEKAL